MGEGLSKGTKEDCRRGVKQGSTNVIAGEGLNKGQGDQCDCRGGAKQGSRAPM